jgi:peptidoglycan/LPS O-acetylase OafA/YrhL
MHRKIGSIDSLRFVCAFWVVMFHGNAPKIEWMADRTHGFWRVIGAFSDVVFNGPAAVIMFFVISGFCIHYPFADDGKLNVVKFLIRRYIRIGVPALVVVGVSHYLPGGTQLMWRLLLWSLYCEVVYYTLYPLLNTLAKRWGWNCLVGVAGGAAAALIGASGVRGGMYARMDAWDALLGLPCWLLGCKVAELVRRSPQISERIHVGYLRLGGWLLSCLAFALMLHAGISFQISLSLFAVYAAFWLYTEAIADQTRQGFLWLELAGAASYSLYLTHPLATHFCQAFSDRYCIQINIWLMWLVKLLFVLIFAAVFYLCIEFPAHRLARRLTRWRS